MHRPRVLYVDDDEDSREMLRVLPGSVALKPKRSQPQEKPCHLFKQNTSTCIY